MKICDLHTHSNNSFDAKYSVRSMCESAVNKGVSCIAITDHCETPLIGKPITDEYGDFSKSIKQSVKDIESVKKQLGAKIEILCGIELGEPMHDNECTKKALSYGNFDFVLASVHFIRNMDDFYFVDFTKTDYKKLLTQYFEEILETASFSKFDSLAHLTYPVRYIKEKLGIYPDLSMYQNIIDEILKTLIKNNKSLEINTQGLYKGLQKTSPDKNTIMRYKELGGELITFGSDSHTTDNIAVGIKESMEFAKRCGFEGYTIYRKHIPIMCSFDD